MSDRLQQWLIGTVVGLLVLGVAAGYVATFLYEATDPMRLVREGPCQSQPLELRADQLRKQALASGDEATARRLLSEALNLYNQSFNKCKSGEAALQIGVAYCNGFGTQKNQRRGIAFIHQAETLGINRERIRRAANDYCK